MNNYERLEGMVAATFTPMDENGDVNLSVIDKYADWIASTPVKGVFVCGTTGEFSSLTIYGAQYKMWHGQNVGRST